MVGTAEVSTGATMRPYLEPLLAPDLDVVIVGVEPGEQSLREGHYYAHPRNAFWSTLHESGWTPRVLRPDEDGTVVGLRIGLDDVYLDPVRLRRRLEIASPRAVCFNSKAALARFVNVDSSDLHDWRGPLAADHTAISGVEAIWAVPDASGRAAGFRAERVALLTDLLKRLGRAPTKA
jgi:hypothetical protein